MNPFKPPHKVDKSGYPVDPVLRNLQKQLGILAAELRGMPQEDTDEKQRQIVEEYRATMDQLYELGWDDILDIEAELPEHLMPEEYTKRHPPLS